MDLNRGDPYMVMLELIEKQFDGEMELPTFEECLRYIYGTKAYIMFTVDKLVQNMTKYVCFLHFVKCNLFEADNTNII
jgi:histone deacetylase complex regulatory component SIN3